MKKESFLVKVAVVIDRDVYPLPVDDDHSEEVESAVCDALYEIDGWEIKRIKATQR